VEHGVEVKRACFPIVDELVPVHVPNLARGDAMLLGDVLKLTGEHTKIQ
jgi:hypothetical protein